MPKQILTQSRLKQILSYDANTGIFTWHMKRKGGAADLIAGSLTQKKYVVIGIEGTYYRAHRLAFLYMEGSLPADQVDHVNRVRDDNRWANLRHSTNQMNSKNTNLRKNNKTGILGVSMMQGLWKAKIGVY